MIQYFDAFGRYEIPEYTLCNIDGKEICSITNPINKEVKMRYNTLSEISFEIVKSDNSIATDEISNESTYWDWFEYRRLIHVANLGYFMIMNHPEQSDGNKYRKTISCKSIDAEFQFKNIVRFGKNSDGISITYPLYNPLYNPEEPESIDNKKDIISIIAQKMPDWTFSYIDQDLITRSHRQFDISKSTLYTFMMKDVQKAYECVFEFDYENKTISLKAVENAVLPVDIYLSHDNLLKDITIEMLSSDMVTALSVYGKGNLSINQVNPIGGDTIYDFSHYMTTDWMSQELIDAIESWEYSINANQDEYARLMTRLITYNAEKLELEGASKPENPDPEMPPESAHIGWGLRALQDEAIAYEGLIAAKIEAGQTYEEEFAELTRINSLIAEKTIIVNDKISQIDDTLLLLQDLNSLLAIENAFTTEQLIELNRFMMSSVYTNENLIQTDIMTPGEVQAQAQQLYEKGKDILSKVSEPQYKFSVDSANFIFDKKFSVFTGLLGLGNSITIEINSVQKLSYPILLGIDFNYDDPTSFELIFGNNLRLNDSTAEFGDILYNLDRTVNAVTFESEDWSSWSDTYSDEVSDFINGALDASLNNLISSSDQELTINQNGLLGRRKNEDGTYSPKQVWLINNTLAFTKNSWNTAEMAVGEILLPNGQYGYGIVAPAIIGQLIAGTNLYIKSEAGGDSPEFEINSDGAFLRNANFTISNSQNVISLNPASGISINRRSDNKDIFKVDSGTGNLSIEGNVIANSGIFNGTINATGGGNIGGWSIIPKIGATPGEIRLDNNHYLKSDGSVKFGGFTLDKNGNTSFSGTLEAASGTFSGHVQAQSLSGTIDWANIVNTPDFASFFNNIGSGYGGFSFGGFGDSLSPTKIGAGRWNFGVGQIGDVGTGAGILHFNAGGQFSSGGALGITSNNGNSHIFMDSTYIRFVSGELYKGIGSIEDNKILSRSENDYLYAYKSHTHSQYYKSGDSAYFSSVIASNGYNGNISVMKRSGTGGYGITITYGIITAVANI